MVVLCPRFRQPAPRAVILLPDAVPVGPSRLPGRMPILEIDPFLVSLLALLPSFTSLAALVSFVLPSDLPVEAYFMSE